MSHLKLSLDTFPITSLHVVEPLIKGESDGDPAHILGNVRTIDPDVGNDI